MKACRWCLRAATAVARGSGRPDRKATGEIPYCDRHEDDAMSIIRQYPTYGWRAIEQRDDTLFA